MATNNTTSDRNELQNDFYSNLAYIEDILTTMQETMDKIREKDGGKITSSALPMRRLEHLTADISTVSWSMDNTRSLLDRIASELLEDGE